MRATFGYSLSFDMDGAVEPGEMKRLRGGPAAARAAREATATSPSEQKPPMIAVTFGATARTVENAVSAVAALQPSSASTTTSM